MMKYDVAINGIQVHAEYSSQAVETIFLPLLRRLTELQRQKGRRILVLLAAPPGAGKTTLLSFLEKLSREHGELEKIQAVGMDGSPFLVRAFQIVKAAMFFSPFLT